MGKIVMPVDYWTGIGLLEIELPWITPEAIQVMDFYIKPHHTVLEFGSGGSTIFMARRAASVVAIESQQEWADKVSTICKDRGIANVDMHIAHDAFDAGKIVAGRQYDVCLVDCVEMDRRDAVSFGLTVLRHPGLMLIDNYAAPYCEGIDQLLAHIPRERITNYDDLKWVGNGTKVVYV